MSPPPSGLPVGGGGWDTTMPPPTTHCPFVVLIDSREQKPWTFLDIKTTPSQEDSPTWDVATERAYLARHIDGTYLGLADYSIKHLAGCVAVERKSMADAHSTLLGWRSKRAQFESELGNLAHFEHCAVIVECSLGTLLAEAPQWGVKTAAENRTSLRGTVLSWAMDYRVPWLFCDSPRMAEVMAFRLLERAWRKCRHLLPKELRHGNQG